MVFDQYLKDEAKEKIKIEIEESPYGDTGTVYDGLLGMMQHFRLQLISFRSPTKTPEEAEYLEADIRGYDEIIKSKSQDNAEAFMELKSESRRGRRPGFRNNEEIVNHLKAEGKWK